MREGNSTASPRYMNVFCARYSLLIESPYARMISAAVPTGMLRRKLGVDAADSTHDKAPAGLGPSRLALAAKRSGRRICCRDMCPPETEGGQESIEAREGGGGGIAKPITGPAL
jgi:hypothetical protein